MALGRKTGGRKKGAANKRTREIADKAAAEGVTPLDLMLREMKILAEEVTTMRADPKANKELLLATIKEMRELAKDAAPYIHPRLQTMTVQGNQNQPLHAKMQIEFV